MANPLLPDKLAPLLIELLPVNAVLSNPASAIAALAHATHTSLGFRLTKPAPQANNAGEEAQNELSQRNKLAGTWFERCSEDESFAISYRHEQSSLLFELRIGRLGGRIVVNAVAVEVKDHFVEIRLQHVAYASAELWPMLVFPFDAVNRYIGQQDVDIGYSDKRLSYYFNISYCRQCRIFARIFF